MDVLKKYGYWDENCIIEFKEIKSNNNSSAFIRNIIQKSDRKIKSLFYEKLQIEKKNEELEKRNNELQNKVNDIYNSTSYKIINSVIILLKKIYNKIK